MLTVRHPRSKNARRIAAAFLVLIVIFEVPVAAKSKTKSVNPKKRVTTTTRRVSTNEHEGDSERREAGLSPNFEDPAYPDQTQLLDSGIDARGKVSFVPFSGKFADVFGLFETRGYFVSDINSGDDGVIYLLFKSSRTYVIADGTGLFSNPMAEKFMALYGSGPRRSGIEMRLVQLSGGYKGVLMSGPGSITVQFGNDDVLVQAVAPPGEGKAVDRVVALASAITKEMAESTPPGKTPGSDPPPPVATSTVAQVTVPYPKSDPHPATGIDPIPNQTRPPSPITTTTKHPS